MNELLCLHRSERYGTCDDEAEAEGQMMPVVPALRISRPHSNTAVLLWTGGENIRFFAAAGWPVLDVYKRQQLKGEKEMPHREKS